MTVDSDRTATARTLLNVHKALRGEPIVDDPKNSSERTRTAQVYLAVQDAFKKAAMWRPSDPCCMCGSIDTHGPVPGCRTCGASDADE